MITFHLRVEAVGLDGIEPLDLRIETHPDALYPLAQTLVNLLATMDPKMVRVMEWEDS